MPSLDREATTYWRSLEAFEAQLESDPELRAFVESEFPEQAADLLDPLSRRRFIQLMGASVALAGVAGAAGCQRWEREKIVPLSERPEGYTPGEAQQYATALEIGGVADGLLVTAYDGRPVKVEGNPQHPFSGGASTSFAQASVLSLYDPDRSMSVRRKDGAGSWDDVASLVSGEIASKGGAGLRVLSEASSSPTLARLRGELLARYPGARWYEYEPLSPDNERLGLEMAGMVPEGVAALRAIPLLDKARRIVALEADLFALHPARLRFARDYARGRQSDAVLSSSPDQALNRLYAIESTFTTTGATADHRLAVPASHMLAFLEVLGVAFQGMGRMRNANAHGGDMPRLVDMTVEGLQSQRDKADGDPSVKVLSDKALRFIAGMAADLLEHVRESVIVAGPELPPEVHARVAMMNAVLIANGNTVEYRALPERRPGHLQDIMALSQEMQAGQVDTLVILGGNPVYTAPADAGFAGALAKVKTSVHLSEYHDETSAACSWHLPRTHYLESWGDCRSYDGTCSLVQPLIEPMWRDQKGRPGKSPVELVAMLLGRGDVSGQSLVRETFDRAFGGGLGDAGWRKALHDGFIEGSAFPVQAPRAPRKVDAPAPAAIPPDRVEVVFRPSTHTFDGRFANNGWLQETPDFITKLTWDNAALINPNTAEHLGLANGDMIALDVEGRSVEVPVYTLPGQARGSVAVALGHGRTRAGRVGGSVEEKVQPAGFDVYGLRSSAAAYALAGVAVRRTGARYELVSTQDHWNMDSVGRDGIEARLGMLIREADAGEYKQDPEVIAHREHEVPMPQTVPEQNGSALWDLHDYDQPRAADGVERYRHRWGMAIDLGKCTGCNSCMLACQAENNVPIVGKEQVSRNREMHWIRIDRYFSAAGRDDLRDDPHIAYQPVACQQCEMAPCEQVCPVGATIHSSEGLNDMVYNRCVGTRYCLNNCPYKVRRFNFLDYLNRSEAPGGPLDDARNVVRKLLFNPDVTVRSRGVMEKCTFCVQRIQRAKIEAKNEGREQVRDGEVLAACQQACPTGAIVFGDLNDQDSAVRKAHEQPRAYALLAGFYTRPRNLFLARIRNPNPYLG